MSNIKNMRHRYEESIDLRQLRYFVKVAEERHFGRAAVSLGMAQPPLTQQIKKLVAALGCRVFVRSRQGITLTEAGKVLFDDSRELLRNFSEALFRTRRAGRGETGELTIGVPPSVMLTRLPTAIRRYRVRFPHVRFILREMSTSAIEAALAAELIDIGFLRGTPTRSLAAEFAFEEGLVAVLPETHTLVKKRGLAVRHMAKEPFVLFPRKLGESFHDELLAHCIKAGFTPNVIQEATQWQSIVTFVETGMGVSIAPASVEKLQRTGVVYKHLAGLSTSVTVCSQGEKKSVAGGAFCASPATCLRGRAYFFSRSSSAASTSLLCPGGSTLTNSLRIVPLGSRRKVLRAATSPILPMV